MRNIAEHIYTRLCNALCVIETNTHEYYSEICELNEESYMADHGSSHCFAIVFPIKRNYFRVNMFATSVDIDIFGLGH